MQNRFVRSEDEREKSVMSTREVRKEGIWRQTNERKYASQRARRDEKLKKKRKPQAFWLDSTVQLSSITILLHGIGGRRCCGEKKLAETRQTLLFSSRPNNNNFWYITVQCWIIYRWQKKNWIFSRNESDFSFYFCVCKEEKMLLFLRCCYVSSRLKNQFDFKFQWYHTDEIINHSDTARRNLISIHRFIHVITKSDKKDRIGSCHELTWCVNDVYYFFHVNTRNNDGIFEWRNIRDSVGVSVYM